jgi:protein-tyrosine phosphatase
MNLENLSTVFLALILLISGVGVEAKAFKCDLKTASKPIQAVADCSDRVVWNPELDAIRKADPAKFDQMVAEQVTRDTNFGSAVVQTGEKSEKELYRSSFTNKSPACLENLVKKRKVTTIINLYSGEIPNNIQMTQEESSLFQKFGGKQYLRILNYDYRMPDSSAQNAIYEKAREVITLVRHAPDNVLMHCYGGQHRTGIIFGIIQKCLNHAPIEDVIAEYRCHTAYENEKKPGGSKAENEKAIREFPCESLGTI